MMTSNKTICFVLLYKYDMMTSELLISIKRKICEILLGTSESL